MKKINLNEEEKKEKTIKENRTYLFFKVFFTNLKENKLYFLSFFITIFTIVFFSVTKVQEAEGLYGNDKDKVTGNTPATPVVDQNLNKPETTPTDEVVDMSDYIGIYSREVKLTIPLTLNETCTIDSYKFVYQVKKDKSITKYLVNDCLGTVKMWSKKASYVSSGGAKYISANKINYLFGQNSMKEVDGETYNIDNNLTTIKEKMNENINVYFYGDNMVINDNLHLVLVKGNTINFNLDDTYPNNGGNLEKRVYKSGATNQFNFIVFSNNEENNCDTEFSGEDSLVYTIYSIKYNTSTNSFADAKKIVTRNKSDKCDYYEDDLKLLEE